MYYNFISSSTWVISYFNIIFIPYFRPLAKRSAVAMPAEVIPGSWLFFCRPNKNLLSIFFHLPQQTLLGRLAQNEFSEKWHEHHGRMSVFFVCPLNNINLATIHRQRCFCRSSGIQHPQTWEEVLPTCVSGNRHIALLWTLQWPMNQLKPRLAVVW